jgi:hypothetical protein
MFPVAYDIANYFTVEERTRALAVEYVSTDFGRGRHPRASDASGERCLCPMSLVLGRNHLVTQVDVAGFVVHRLSQDAEAHDTVLEDRTELRRRLIVEAGRFMEDWDYGVIANTREALAAALGVEP